MCQQLGLDAVDSRRLLQRFDDVGEQAPFDFLPICAILTFAYEQITNHALGVLIYEKGISKDASA